MASTLVEEQLRSCLDACTEAAQACEACAKRCIEAAQAELVDCVKLCPDCATLGDAGGLRVGRSRHLRGAHQPRPGGLARGAAVHLRGVQEHFLAHLEAQEVEVLRVAMGRVRQANTRRAAMGA